MNNKNSLKSLRIDKYLKYSLIFKTRNAAENSLKAGNVLVNGKRAKPSTKVKCADIIQIEYPTSTVKYQVLALHSKSVSKSIARESYKKLL